MDTQNAPAAITTSIEPPSIQHKHLTLNLDPNFSDAPTSTTPQLPQRPTKLPFHATDENIPKLEQYLLDQFCKTTFNRSAPSLTMSSPPAHIHLKDGAIPYACHTSIPAPLHWKGQVKASLDDDVKGGIIAPVPVGTLVIWCSQMIITAKKDGTTRHTVDLQHLNSQCLHETHHCQSSFQLACQVPSSSKKTILDAVDGYHTIVVDKTSQPHTPFITEWGQYMYLRLLQGFLASGDAYTRCYDDVIKYIPR